MVRMSEGLWRLAQPWRERVQDRRALLRQAQQIEPDAGRRVNGTGSPALHGANGHIEVSRQLGLPARPVQSLAALGEEPAHPSWTQAHPVRLERSSRSAC